MEVRKYYMHKNAMDVCIDILKWSSSTKDSSTYLVHWINLGYTNNPWGIRVQEITIENKDIQNWIEIDLQTKCEQRAIV